MLDSPVNLALAVGELLLVVLAPLPNAYFLYLLCHRHDLHNNLRLLLGFLSLVLTLIALTRLPTLAHYIATGQLYVGGLDKVVFVHEVAVMFIRTVILPLTLERCLATWRSKSYEREERPYFGVAVLLITLAACTVLASFVATQLNHSDLDSNGVIHFHKDATYTRFQLIDVSVRFVLWLVCFIVFLLLLYYNRRWYDFSRMPNKHHLAQRYQLAENVRANRQLLGVGTLIFAVNLYFDVIMLMIYFNRNHFPVEYNQSFDFVLALALNAIPVLAIAMHPRMLSAYLTHVQVIGEWWFPSTSSSSFGAGETEDGGGAENNTCSVIIVGETDARHAQWQQQQPLTSPAALVIENKARGSNAADHADSSQQQQQQRRVSLKNVTALQPRALISGTRLIVEKQEEQGVYFDQLQRSWSVMGKVRRENKKTSFQY